MKNAVLITFTLFVFTQCNSGKQQVEAPCMTEKVEQFADDVMCESGASVNEFKFKGELVYVFNHGNCGNDFAQGVYNYNCNLMGYLGGISGEAEIDGTPFYDNASLKRTLFEN